MSKNKVFISMPSCERLRALGSTIDLFGKSCTPGKNWLKVNNIKLYDLEPEEEMAAAWAEVGHAFSHAMVVFFCDHADALCQRAEENDKFGYKLKKDLSEWLSKNPDVFWKYAEEHKGFRNALKKHSETSKYTVHPKERFLAEQMQCISQALSEHFSLDEKGGQGGHIR